MCIIVVKPKEIVLTKELLGNCFFNNHDGAGFAIIDKDEKGENSLDNYLGMFDFETFWKTWEPHQDKQAILHFRIATHKVIDAKNSHPHRINDDLVLAHNGRLPGLPDSEDQSDTAIFCETVIKPLAEANPNFWMIDGFKWFIEHAIGVTNKLAMMDTAGNVRIFNAHIGTEHLGCWFSNYSYGYRGGNFTARNHAPTPPVHHTPDDVIDIEAEIVAAANQSSDKKADGDLDKMIFKDLIDIEADFETEDLDEIDRRLALVSASQS